MTRRFYVDTSAYLTVLLGQLGHEKLTSELEGAELLSSTLLLIEAQRNLIRHAREGGLRPADLSRVLARLESDAEGFLLRDPTPELCLAREVPMVSTPRSPDLIHLRTALWFHRRKSIDRFVSLDSAQAAAAHELGLPV
jgi:hypothetical protein